MVLTSNWNDTQVFEMKLIIEFVLIWFNWIFHKKKLLFLSAIIPATIWNLNQLHIAIISYYRFLLLFFLFHFIILLVCSLCAHMNMKYALKNKIAKTQTMMMIIQNSLMIVHIGYLGRYTYIYWNGCSVRTPL